MRLTFLVTASALTALSSAFAQQAAPTRTPPSILTSQTRPGSTLNDVLTTSRRVFRELDANSDGALSRGDAEIHESMARANSRSDAAGRIMRYDLDGDGSVTQGEVNSRLRYDRRQRDEANAQAAEQANIEAELRRVLAADTDQDGRVTWQEALNSWAAGPNALAQTTQGSSANIREILAFAGKSDGALNAAEFVELFTQLFQTTDTDGNGTLSQEEFARAQQQVQERTRLDQIAKARADCVMPKASNAAKVVLLSGYEARGLSTATIGSQEVTVRTGQITIDSGAEPLYLVVLSSSPVIWRFDGAIERIERVVLGSNAHQPNTSAGKKPLAGATGVPDNKIQFLPRSDCLHYFSEAPSTSAATTTALVRNDTGKEPTVAARYGVSSFSAPSGVTTPQQNAAGAERPALIIQKQSGILKVEGDANVVIQAGPVNLVSEVNRFFPDGVIKIDPTAVVATAKVEPYEVLPSQAGLLQLVNSGALEQRGGEFHIKQKIRFPAGLYGAHSARFLLLRGVPLPDGTAGHSCVISEETGQPIAKSGATCR
ncbi:EF-hand domain-containing protein [Boseaceae bacterium BT-24-1]|nr:EF-hand domain-containing protein [Boseaceae bacterium BT-24-1]